MRLTKRLIFRKVTLVLSLLLFMLSISSEVLANTKTMSLRGVWGLKFGQEWTVVHERMTETNACQVSMDVVPDPDSRELFYHISFFGRAGEAELSFGGRGLYRVRMIFSRPVTLKRNAANGVWGGHFRQLLSTLRSKYGDPLSEWTEAHRLKGCRWFFKNNRTITLFESDSLSGHNTVLTYEAPDVRMLSQRP